LYKKQLDGTKKIPTKLELVRTDSDNTDSSAQTSSEPLRSLIQVTLQSRSLLTIKQQFRVQFYGMVWYGMVWYGMVWYGMVWYGMVWYGIVWYGMVLYCMVWCGYGMALYCMV
jgi:hypothetical protein